MIKEHGESTEEDNSEVFDMTFATIHTMCSGLDSALRGIEVPELSDDEDDDVPDLISNTHPKDHPEEIARRQKREQQR